MESYRCPEKTIGLSWETEFENQPCLSFEGKFLGTLELFDTIWGKSISQAMVVVGIPFSFGAHVKFAKLLKRNQEGVVAYFDLRIDNGSVEAMNNNAKAISHRARDYRSSETFSTLLMHCLGGLGAPNWVHKFAWGVKNLAQILMRSQILFTPRMTWKGDGGFVRMRPQIVFPAMEQAGICPGPMIRFGFFHRFLANGPKLICLDSFLTRIRLWNSLLPFQIFWGRLEKCNSEGKWYPGWWGVEGFKMDAKVSFGSVTEDC